MPKKQRPATEPAKKRFSALAFIPVGVALALGPLMLPHAVVPKRSDPGTLYFSRPVAIRVTKKGLEAGLDPFHDASAAGI